MPTQLNKVGGLLQETSMAIPQGCELIVLLPLHFLPPPSAPQSPSPPPIKPSPPPPVLDMADLTLNELTAVEQLVQLSEEADAASAKSPRPADSSSSSSVSPGTGSSVARRQRGEDQKCEGRNRPRPRRRKFKSISRIYESTRPVVGFVDES